MRLTKEQHEHVSKEAKKQDLSINQFIVKLIESSGRVQLGTEAYVFTVAEMLKIAENYEAIYAKVNELQMRVAELEKK